MSNLVEATNEDFASLLGGEALQGLRLPPDADRDIIAHVAAIARLLRAEGCRKTWMIVFQGEVVGLCGCKKPPVHGTLEIGYNVWPSRQNAGHASRAVAEVLRLARNDPSIHAIVAETTADNVPSHRVLEKNGFERTGTRHDDEDGDLIV